MKSPALNEPAKLTQLKVAVLAFDGVRPFQLSVPCEIFGETHTAGDRAKLQVCSLETRPVKTSSGFLLETAYGLDELVAADVVFIPSWNGPEISPSPELIAALRAGHENGAIMVGLCLGAFVLAETGLLDGKRATTHWAFADKFRERFPRVELDESQIYVDEGRLLTSAGVAAGVDCCLYLANRLFGAQLADQIARNIVAAPHRMGGQSQFIGRPHATNNRDRRMRDTMERIVTTIDRRHSIDSVAECLGMSRRNFTRHFQQTMGIGFHDWLADQKLDKAKMDLQNTSKPVARVAQDAGFGSAVTFRTKFVQRFGMSPTQWRKTRLPDSL